jgi:hypothetical protein
MTPEERSAYGKQLAARRKPENMRRPYRDAGKGVPKGGWTAEAVEAAKAAARLEALALVRKLRSRGIIGQDDKEGEAATVEALTLIRSPCGSAERLRKAEQLLRHYHPPIATP